MYTHENISMPFDHMSYDCEFLWNLEIIYLCFFFRAYVYGI